MANQTADLEIDSSLRSRARQGQMRFAATARADRTSRRVLTTLLVLIIILAALALALSYGAFGSNRQHQSILSHQTLSHVQEQARWIWLGIGVAAIVLALLAARWLGRMVLPEPASDDLHRSKTDQDETTTVQAHAIADIVTAELTSLPGVSDAASRLSPDGTTALAWIRLDDAARVDDLRSTITGEVLGRLREALGYDAFGLDVEVRPSTVEAARVG